MQSRTIDLNTVNQIKIESLENIEKLLFKDVYGKADQLLLNIIQQNYSVSAKLDEQIPNVISFLGARGRGKTSAMLSFLFWLSKLQEKPNCWSRLNAIEHKVRFFTLPYIDAATLADNEYVLDVILAEMWNSSQRYIEKTYGSADDANLIHLQQQLRDGFVKVRKAYLVLKSKECKQEYKQKASEDEPVASALQKLSASMNLRKELQKLIKNYVDMMHYDVLGRVLNSDKKCYLVVAIDDVDMSASMAHHILEEVRRFLSIPGVIVLLTADLDRLKIMCESHYSSYYENDEKNLYHFINDYLEKILPYNTRISLPELNEDHGGLMIVKGELQQIYPQLPFDKMQEKDWILKLIAQKCGIYFDGTRRRRHFMQSSSLREMINYFEQLVKVEKENCYDWLKFDLMNRLAERIQDKSQRAFIKSLFALDEEDVNLAVIRYLKEHLPKDIELKYDKSLGQVLYGCSLMEETDVQNIEFVNCILLFYTIVLVQADDEIKEKIIGNSILGEWEYSAISPSKTMKQIKGFKSRSVLELTTDHEVSKLLDEKKTDEVICRILQLNKENIIGWLYMWLFVEAPDAVLSDAAGFTIVPDNRNQIPLNHDQARSNHKNNAGKNSYFVQLKSDVIANENCFGFIFEKQGNAEEIMQSILDKCMDAFIKVIYEQTLKGFEKSNTVERKIQELKKMIKSSGSETGNLAPKNVEIIYSIGKTLGQEIAASGETTEELMYERMVYQYQAIGKELEKKDNYYQKIGEQTSFADAFRGITQVKIFLEPDFLQTNVKECFKTQFSNLFADLDPKNLRQGMVEINS